MTRILSILAFLVAVVAVDAGSAYAQGADLRNNYTRRPNTFKAERFQSKFQKARMQKRRPRARVPELGASGAAAALALLGGAAAVAHGRRRVRVRA